MSIPNIPYQKHRNMLHKNDEMSDIGIFSYQVLL